MEENNVISSNKKIVRVIDILEQIESLNQMIDFHKEQSNNNSMLSQYEQMKNEFVEELNAILLDFKIKIPAA